MEDINETRPLLTYEQAARALGIKLNTLYSWVRDRKIPHVRLGDRLVRFDHAEIEKFVEDRRVAATR